MSDTAQQSPMPRSDTQPAPAGTWLRAGDPGMGRGQIYASLVAVALLAAAGLFTLK